MNSEDGQVYSVCMQSKHKQTKCKHSRRNSYRLQLFQQVSLYKIKELQGVPRNMTVGEQFRMSFSIIMLSCLIPKSNKYIKWESCYIKIDFIVKYNQAKDLFD